ncbi:DinB family protein [Bacillus sp. BRMEA1]|uniref:DinB family protein n=1 Tax=Neobacillus endophyticus TaxID=2738405 RepID=UPI00156462AD|nr:DinB family protein [Neobacillus endophyticus]NRD77075.1 DinB family protein [Neobacillus endophyticus]
MKRRELRLSSLPDFEPDIGRWMWCLEDVRRTLLEKISGISQAHLDTRLNNGHSIGSLIYHIALIEADWLYVEILGCEWDPKILSLFPQEVRNNDDTLTHIEGHDLEEHLHRLKSVRDELLFHIRSMDIKTWREPRVLPQYDVTPEWVIYHLIEHESHHRGQIFQMLSILQSNLS